MAARGQVPTFRWDPGRAARTPFVATPLFPNGPRDDRCRLGSHTGNSTLPPARASGCLLRVPGRGSSGRSAASPEPTAQSPAPPREPPPGSPGQRVPVTVARRPLVPKGSQGEDPRHGRGSSSLASLGTMRDHGTMEGQRHALLHPHTQTHGLLHSHSTTLREEHIATQVHTYELSCSLVHPFTTRLQSRALIQATRHTLTVYAQALAHTCSGANRVLSSAHNHTHWHGTLILTHTRTATHTK